MKDGFFTTSDGVRLHYLESGAGPTIVFLPGWMMPATIWRPQLEYFSRAYHVVALDPRSQGESEKPAEGNHPRRRAKDYTELIDHLGGGPVVLVVWSLSVHEVLTYLQHSGTFRWNALVLIDMPMYTEPTAPERDQRYEMLHQLQANRNQYAESFVRGMYHKPQPEEYLAAVTAATLRTPTTTAVALLAERSVKNDLRSALPMIKVPTLAFMTELNRASAELIAATVPGSQTEVFGDAGHCLFVDDADRFNAVLEGFLQKHL